MTTFWRFLSLLLLFSLLPLLAAPKTAVAQTPTAYYWQRPTTTTAVAVIDIDQNGIDEFLIAEQGGTITLLGANGIPLWQYEAQIEVTTVTAINLESSPNIVLAGRNQVILLTESGVEAWRIATTAQPMPPDLQTSGNEETRQEWFDQAPAIPVTLHGVDYNNDGIAEILLSLATGQLQLFNISGQPIWSFAEGGLDIVDTPAQVIVKDLDQDGELDIVRGLFDPDNRFSTLTLININADEVWSQPVSGRITALSVVQFEATDNHYVAVGTSLGEITLYDASQRKKWVRTVNTAITNLTLAQLPDGPHVVVGTTVGTAIAFDHIGRRLWTNYLVPNANEANVFLAASPTTATTLQPTIAAIITTEEEINIRLLNAEGQSVKTLPYEANHLTQLVDVNHDQHPELLLVTAEAIILSGLDISNSSIKALDWEYTLLAAPTTSLVTDLDVDGQDELIVAAQDGRVHLLEQTGRHRWVILLDRGYATHIKPLIDPTNLSAPRQFVLAYQSSGTNTNGDSQNYIELRQANGSRVWQQEILHPASSLLVADLDAQSQPEIIVGTEAGEVIVFNLEGLQLWQTSIIADTTLATVAEAATDTAGADVGTEATTDTALTAAPIPNIATTAPIQYLHLISGADRDERQLIVATQNDVYSVTVVSDGNVTVEQFATYNTPLIALYGTNQPGVAAATAFITITADGILSGYTRNGTRLPPWPLTITAPSIAVPATFIEDNFTTEPLQPNRPAPAESFLIATTAEQFVRLDIQENEPSLTPERASNMGMVSTLYWGDLTGDRQPDIAAGDENGRIHLFDRSLMPIPEPLDLSTPLFAITALYQVTDPQVDLLVITDNGPNSNVQLFRAQENHPPLLTNLQTEIGEGQYSLGISVQDVEKDTVTVTLEIETDTTIGWVSQGERQLFDGNGDIFWPVVDVPVEATTVHFRFTYDDGLHQGTLAPIRGTPPTIIPPLVNLSRMVIAISGVGSFLLVMVFLWQMQSPASKARRFYRQLQKQPTHTLLMIERQYQGTSGSPDFLLHLAQEARQANNRAIAGLADGLFLLADRPDAGLPILTSALQELEQQKLNWKALDRWQATYQLCQAFLETATIRELSLLRPKLVSLLATSNKNDVWLTGLEILLPILTSLRDSERVELAEDRLIYLQEASLALLQNQEQLPQFSLRMEKTLMTAILKRWSGLVNASIEELRGQAELIVTLKTKRIAPSQQIVIIFTISNSGRAAAEHIIAALEPDPAYHIVSAPQLISVLLPRRTAEVSYTIQPQTTTRFRVALTLTYDDRNQYNRALAFGDMVHLLAPARDFKPIPNPYVPGTPLRRDSPLFVGRQALFDFIAENAERVSQRNIMILIGQRRTGKTSILLRLEQHLSKNLLPVYIDCQALGVTPGMPSLLHELAWLIADSLVTRDIDVDVPELTAWQEDPTRLFQRQFLPQVHALLPKGTTILLIFDEFEQFEKLVDDNILPSTIFTYLRHLMQHSEGLSFIFVGTRQLEEMSTDYWNVLFNIALYHRIGYLNKASATNLICKPVATDLIYDDLALDKILRVTAGHPYFLQLVCYTLVKRANEQKTGYVTISDVNATLDEMLKLGEVHFAYLWQRSTYTERAILTAVSHLMDPDRPFHPEEPMQKLEPYGIHLNPISVTSALTQLVERNILRETPHQAKSLYEVNIGLVNLWIAKNKSLSKLYLRHQQN